LSKDKPAASRKIHMRGKVYVKEVIRQVLGSRLGKTHNQAKGSASFGIDEE
jgi:hypothetical protein